MRDQERVLYAYKQVAGVQDCRDDYEIALQTFTGTLVRSGLAAAMAALERIRKREGTKLLLDHLAGAGIPGLEGTAGQRLAGKVRELDLDGYMLATREMFRLAAWFRRAVQAEFE
ncbi:MAG: type III-B CRISPR module-associated protein Cmr5 [Rhodospirillales bacterium]|nr:type III-B CRISPR module-associated protein Cmr5 [Rhodospirillales bacterium]